MVTTPAVVGAKAALSFTSPKYEVRVERDVVYAQARGYWAKADEEEGMGLGKMITKLGRQHTLDLDMDIYLPEDGGASARPLLLMLHGGSFFFGNKEENGQSEWCRYFASLGYVAASINYRLGFNIKKKDIARAEDYAVEDARSALEYLLGREDLRIDPGKVFAAGTSAGASTVMVLAFTPGAPRIRAVCSLWGSLHSLQLMENSGTAILSYQSVKDPVMPYTEGYPFTKKAGALWPPSWMFIKKMYGTGSIHQRALELGLRSEHHPIQEPGHRLHIGHDGSFTPLFYEIRDRMASFFAEEMQTRQHKAWSR
ncbi:MAG: alpha/beta hydrolase [Bacteroidales bacterium]|nr:alpha/beta hydrolase [Bacteroidales bacterium]